MAERIYVALDLETTGLKAGKDAIIELAAVRFQGDGVLDRFSTIVNPLRPIPLFIQQLTGIGDLDVMEAPTLDRVLPELLAFVDRDVERVIAHNADFDIGFLRAAGVNFHRPVLDTFELATVLLPRLPSYSLGELCAVLDIPLADAHRALDDAEATARLFMILQRRLHTLPAVLLQEILSSGQEAKWPPLLLFEDALWQATTSGALVRATDDRRREERGSDLAFPDGALHPDEGGRMQSIPQDAIARYFEPGGPLARQIGPDYELRQGQIEMARQVTQALSRGEQRLIEAGTGTGKSLAYLIPAALWSQANRQRVVIATHTIALQDQLIDKDIPQVQALLQEAGEAMPGVQAALLKGRSNYLCTRRLHAWCHSHRLSPLELRLLAKVLVWLLDTRTGDSSELFLADPAERAVWAQICSDPATCTPERCSVALPVHDERPNALGRRFRDFFWEARRQAEPAHLLIVNHALLLANTASGGRVLPHYDHLIVDEAHHLEEAATDQLTFRVDRRSIFSLLAALDLGGDLLALLSVRPAWLDLVEELRLHARQAVAPLNHFVDALLQLAGRQEGIQANSNYTQRLALDSRMRAQPRWSQVEIEWEDASVELRQTAYTLDALVEALEGARWWQDEPQATYLNELQAMSAQVAELLRRLDEILFQPGGIHNQESVPWLELTGDGKEISFCVAPLYVGDVIEARLVRQLRAAVFTGATLRTGSGFDFMRDRLGLWDADASTMPSPFDYRNNTLVYMPSNLPEPNRPCYQQALEQAIILAAQAAGGRTMALFTSYAHLRATAEGIRAPLDQLGITVLQHGTSSRRRLLLAYRHTERAVLLGTRSFWEGVDLAGDQLSCVLIARLPFAVPTDPLVAARSGVFDDAFHDYMLPEAVIRFRQGFGRLIRRASDRGIVVLLDSRIWRRDYGTAFLDALPPCTTRHGPLANLGEHVAQWLYDE